MASPREIKRCKWQIPNLLKWKGGFGKGSRDAHVAIRGPCVWSRTSGGPCASVQDHIGRGEAGARARARPAMEGPAATWIVLDDGLLPHCELAAVLPVPFPWMKSS